MGILELYKNYFLKFGSNRRWDDNTLLLYLFVIALAFLAGFFINKRKNNKGNVALYCYFVLFLFLGIIMGCRDISVGIDTLQYGEIFKEINILDIISTGGTEPGFRLFVRILSQFTNNPSIAILLISLAIVLFIGKSLWNFRNSINLCFAIGIYVGIFYLQSFNLMRIFLASSIMLLGFHFLIDGRYKKYCFVVCLAATFHFSSVVMFMPVLFLLLYKKYKNVAFGIILLLIILVGPVTNLISNYLTYDRYSQYLISISENRFPGPMLFFEYSPFIIIACMLNNKHRYGSWFDLFVAFSLTGFYVRYLAYYIPAAGRLYVNFMPLFILLLPFFVQQIKKESLNKYYFITYYLIFYIIVRIHLYLSEYLAVDGIMPYSFFWNN